MAPSTSKGKGKAVASFELLSIMEIFMPPHSLEALMTDSSLFEEPLLKDPNEEVISSLSSIYSKEVTKKVDSTPF